MKEMRGKTTPCDECMIELLPKNYKAFKTFAMTQNQMIVTGMGDIIDIDFLAVEKAMTILRIPIEQQEKCWEKVKKIFKIYSDKIKGVQQDPFSTQDQGDFNHA